MVLFQLITTRFIQVYIAQGLVLLVFIILAIKLICNEPKRTKIILSGFYFFGGVGLFINFIYALIYNQAIVKFFNFITNFCVVFSVIFPMVFCLTFYKGDEKVGITKQLVSFSVYGLFVFLMILIPNGVEINEHTGWTPHWSILLFIYVSLVMTAGAVIPTIYYALKIH